jgi:hypothetical protein
MSVALGDASLRAAIGHFANRIHGYIWQIYKTRTRVCRRLDTTCSSTCVCQRLRNCFLLFFALCTIRAHHTFAHPSVYASVHFHPCSICALPITRCSILSRFWLVLTLCARAGGCTAPIACYTHTLSLVCSVCAVFVPIWISIGLAVWPPMLDMLFCAHVCMRTRAGWLPYLHRLVPMSICGNVGRYSGQNRTAHNRTYDQCEIARCELVQMIYLYSLSVCLSVRICELAKVMDLCNHMVF